MSKLNWQEAEATLFKESQRIIEQFAAEHPKEQLCLFAYSVDSLYTGVALNFDTPANSRQSAKAAYERQVKRRNQLFASENGWKDACNIVKSPWGTIDDFNREGSWKHELVGFIELTAWEQFFNHPQWNPDEPESEMWTNELNGRIAASVWRVVDRLIQADAFNALHCVSPFRILFGFHDDPITVLRILHWPT